MCRVNGSNLKGAAMKKSTNENKESLKPKPQGFPNVRVVSPSLPLTIKDTLGWMSDQDARLALLGSARLQPYLAEAAGDLDRAFELYAWAVEIAGAMHSHLSYVEIAARNALDLAIADRNETQGTEYGRAWSLEHHAAPQLYALMKNETKQARRNATHAVARRAADHPRHGVVPTHDDVVAQMSFGTWSTLIAGQVQNNARQRQFWLDATHNAFPHLADTEQSRRWVGHQLEELRDLRNRVAHHDNILRVNIGKRLSLMLSLLAKINPDYPSLAMTRSQLRRLVREDPRRSW